MAQTTRRASFEPVLLVATFCGPLTWSTLLKYHLHIAVSTNKTRKKRKKDLLAQTMHDTSFGHVLLLPLPLVLRVGASVVAR